MMLNKMIKAIIKVWLMYWWNHVKPKNWKNCFCLLCYSSTNYIKKILVYTKTIIVVKKNSKLFSKEDKTTNERGVINCKRNPLRFLLNKLNLNLNNFIKFVIIKINNKEFSIKDFNGIKLIKIGVIIINVVWLEWKNFWLLFYLLIFVSRVSKWFRHANLFQWY